MAKFNASQFKSKMRSIQNQYNREMKSIERKLNQGINNYNREVRKFNAELRQNQSKIKSELAKLQRNSTIRAKTNYEISVHTVNTSYSKLNQRFDFNNEKKYGGLLEVIEKENANNLEVANILLENDEPENEEYSLEETKISNDLMKISEDLDNRWRGAIFALNPKNPDATRHFCTSTREIFTQLIDCHAKDENVLNVFPNCEKTNNGSVSRRAKIKYLLHKKGVEDNDIEEFIHEDIENILKLLCELNGGTHGNAGKYTINQLKGIKKRAESGLSFLCEYVV